MYEHIIAIVFVLTGISLAQIVLGTRLRGRIYPKEHPDTEEKA